MKLNEKIPGLPKWPPIEFQKRTNEYLVRVNHVSYGGFKAAIWLRRLLTLAYFAFAVTFCLGLENRVQGFFCFLLVFFLPYAIAVSVLPIPRILCGAFFPQRTESRFRVDQFSINGKSYKVVPGVTIQFRALDRAASASRQNGIRNQLSSRRKFPDLEHELEFTKVDMIYGSRVVTVATIADQSRAEQLAIGLQTALELAISRETPGSPIPAVSQSKKEVELPE